MFYIWYQSLNEIVECLFFENQIQILSKKRFVGVRDEPDMFLVKFWVLMMKFETLLYNL